MWPEIQDDFARAVRSPNLPPPTGLAGGAARFDVYRNNVAVSLREALADAYPVVKALVGADFFAALAQAFVRENLPETPVLAHYGAGFAAFIDGFDAARPVPYLADVARLERLWLEAYHAADADPLGIEALAAVPETDMTGLQMNVHPSFRLLRSDWPVVSIWRAHQGAGAPDLSAIAFEPECARIVRPALTVEVSALSAASFDFHARLRAGVPFGPALDAVAADPEADPSAVLLELFEAGCITGLSATT